MPKATIIITTHHRPHLLTRAVESALAAGTDTEVVVVDDASTDETAKVCQTLPGIRYVRVERNQRVAGARNVGLLASSGEYISFLDDDDVRLAHSLDMQVKALEAAPEAGMIYAQALVGDQTGSPTARLYPLRCLEGDIFWQLLGQNFIPCGSVVFRRSCLSRLGLLDEAVPGLDDWDLWIRISELYPVIALTQPVVVWRQSTPDSDQGTSLAAPLVRQSARQFRYRWMTMARACKAPQSVRLEARGRFAKNMTSHLVWEAARSLACGRLRACGQNLFTALRLFPLEVVRVAGNGKNIRALLVNHPNRRRSTETRTYLMKEQAGRSKS